LHKLLDMFS